MSSYKNIVITGASSGVGRALAIYYAGPNTNLCLISRGITSPIADTEDICKRKGASTFTFSADVQDESSMRSIAKSFISAVGAVDLVIANAGIREVEDENNQDLSISKRVMNVNFFGVLNTVSPFLLMFKEQKNGHIAVISSIAAYRGMPNSGIYSASKAALNIWFESLRLRISGDNLKITVISLSFVSTEMTARLPFWMPGLLTPDEAATKIGNAILRKKRTIIIPWQSAIIWSLLNNMPNRLYDGFILFAKKYGPRRR